MHTYSMVQRNIQGKSRSPRLEAPRHLCARYLKCGGMGHSLLKMESSLVEVCLVADDTRTQPLTVGKKRRSIGQHHTWICVRGRNLGLSHIESLHTQGQGYCTVIAEPRRSNRASLRSFVSVRESKPLGLGMSAQS